MSGRFHQAKLVSDWPDMRHHQEPYPSHYTWSRLNLTIFSIGEASHHEANGLNQAKCSSFELFTEVDVEMLHLLSGDGFSFCAIYHLFIVYCILFIVYHIIVFTTLGLIVYYKFFSLLAVYKYFWTNFYSRFLLSMWFLPL